MLAVSVQVQAVAGHLPTDIRTALLALSGEQLATLEELRFRVGQPLEVITASGRGWLTTGGRVSRTPSDALIVTTHHMRFLVESATGASLYAVEHELRNGYLSLPGGHRLGVCGRVVLENGDVRTLRDLASANLRLARQVNGAADALLGRVLENGRAVSTLIVSPPQAGKTTMLRDLVRQLSAGARGVQPHTVGVVDERGELGSCADGVPQNDLGPRTDVLDGCPKPAGIAMLVRAMAPDVIATDEIGTAGDMHAISDAQRCGVAVVATAHGGSLTELAARPAIGPAIVSGAFARFVLLSRRRGPGTIEMVLTAEEIRREAASVQAHWPPWPTR